MKKELKFTVNGDPYELAIKPQRTLLEVLRNELGLTGTKMTCEGSACGMCTVLLDDMAVKSCSVLALQANGRKVTTIEGLAKEGKLHPIQQAFIKHGAIQCGFCTPGMVLVAKALLDKDPSPSEEKIKEALSGNLCRCTGYTSIVRALESLCEGNR